MDLSLNSTYALEDSDGFVFDFLWQIAILDDCYDVGKVAFACIILNTDFGFGGAETIFINRVGIQFEAGEIQQVE